MENFEPRDQQASTSSTRDDASGHDKDALKPAADKIDQGPAFGTPGEPPDADPDAIEEIEKAHEDPGLREPRNS